MSTFTQLFSVSQSGMRLNMLDMDNISNNLANINTDGYKATRLNFQEMLNQNTLEGGTLAGQQTDMDQGALKTTTRNMDWAISGNGYFAIKMPDGKVAYTRNGSFDLDANHNIVTTEGLPLVWNGTLPTDAEQVQIDTDGYVSYHMPDEDTSIRHTAGQVSLYRFINPSGLESNGSNLFIATEESGAAIGGVPNSNGLGSTVGFSLENSNVDLSEQFSHMLVVQRAFQITSRALSQSDSMLSQAIQMRQA
ncbi:MAG: flagellar hook-basal body complex protein [Anaerolineae bacterium]|nr:flagellar hook-basal body complex protein [Anaerolineae bacterium]